MTDRIRDMRLWNRRNWQPAFMIGLLLLCLPALSGCLKRNVPLRRTFMLTTEHPARPAGDMVPSGAGLILMVESLDVAPPYEGRDFVYKRADGTWHSDFHNGFFNLPVYVFTEELMEWMQNSPRVGRVVMLSGQDVATHVLAGRIMELYGDYSGETPRAVLRMEMAVLNNLDVGDADINLHKSYLEEIPLPDETVEALVQGWSDGLANILTRLEGELPES